MFWTFVSKIDGFQFEPVSTLNKKPEISFFVIMWIDFAWILVLYFFGKAFNRFQSFVLIYQTQMFDYLFMEPKVPSHWISKLLCLFTNLYKLCLIHDQRMARTWMIMTILDNCWWKYVPYVLVKICFYRNMFQCIFILVKYVSSTSDILITSYISNVSNISFVSREYYVLGCYKLDIINMTL